MNQDMAWMLLRYTLLAVGGMAVAKGWVSDEQVTALVGAAGVAFTVIWGTYIKWSTKTVSAVTGARSDVDTLSPMTGKVDAQH